MQTGSPPPAPDPYAVSSAEGQSNIQTALANQTLANPNVVGPTGSTTYSNSGQFQTVTMPDGSTAQVERPTQTTTLTPQYQNIFDTNTQTQQNIANIGRDQSSRIGDILGQPVNYDDLKLDPNNFSADRQRVEQAMYERMQPQLDRELSAEQNRLTNQGFQQGTDAWRGAMDDYNRRINDLRLGITANGLGEQQGLYSMARDAAGYEMQRRTQQQNQPINAITALLSGSQVSMPNVPGYNAPTVAGTNLGQNAYTSAALTNDAWKTQSNQNAKIWGDILGAAGKVGSTAIYASDRRLKRDIREIGAKLKNGLKLYAFKYIWDDVRHIGVMADEVLKVRPDAVVTMPNGYMAVDYSRLG